MNATREAILDAALDLLAEQGYAGASLRKVAKRVGVAQPSLYHHFATKEALVEQVIAANAGRMFSAMDPDDLPKRLEDVPRYVIAAVQRLYDGPTHAKFVRVAFAVARLNERYENMMKTIFIDQATIGMRLMMKPFIDRGEIEANHAVDLVRMIINALGLRLIEHRVLFGKDVPGGELRRFTAFVIEAGECLIERYRKP